MRPFQTLTISLPKLPSSIPDERFGRLVLPSTWPARGGDQQGLARLQLHDAANALLFLQMFTRVNWSGLSRILILLAGRSAAPGQ